MSNDNHSDVSNYGYTPSSAWCIIYVVLFSLTALVHSAQAYRSKYWVFFPTLVLGALIEVLGWSGRYWSSQNVTLLDPFLMQICTLTLAPVFFSAYDYVLLGGAIRHIGAQYSVLRPGWYFTCFLIADVISLILQAVGGGQAASSAATGEPTVTATNIMVAGIIFQLISMLVFVALGFDFVLRASTRRPYVFRQRQIAAATLKSKSKASEKSGDLSQTPSDETSSDEIRPETQTVGEDVEGRQNLTRWWTMLSGAMISSIMILIRGVYRSIELRQGWSGFLITHQIYQSTLDGLPMFIAVATFNFIHPWFVLGRKLSWKGYH